MPARGICPVDAIWVQEIQDDVVLWEGWYAAYDERVSFRRKLESTQDSATASVDEWENAPVGSFRELYTSAKFGVKYAFHEGKYLVRDTYDSVSGARAKRVAAGIQRENAQRMPSNHHRALYSSSDDDNGPSYYFAYNYCIRREHLSVDENAPAIFTDMDAQNESNGVVSQFGEAWDDWIFTIKLLKGFMIYTWCILLAYLYFNMLSLKYSFFRSVRLMNAGIFPQTICFALDITFVAVSAKISTLITGSSFLTPEMSTSASWAPFFPACDVLVETASGNRINRALFSFGILLVIFRVLSLSVWLYDRFIKVLSDKESHELQLETIVAKIPYKLPSHYKKVRDDQEAVAKAAEKAKFE